MTVETVPVPAGASVPGGRTNAYLVGTEGAVVIDPADRTPALEAAVADRGVAHVAATHTHPDHVGGLADVAAATGATVWARAGREARFRRATGVVPDRTFREGTAVGGTIVVEAPGHASDHVAFLVDGEALVGDVAVASGSVGLGASGDLRAYLTTLRRLRTMALERLRPGHGPPIDDPDAVLERLIGHRLDREARIREAVTAGAETVRAVVATAYDGDVSGASTLVESTVRAHLRKLAVEGAIDWDGERARPRRESL